MNKLSAYRSLFIWLLIGVMMILLFNLLGTQKKGETEMIFSEFMDRLNAGEVEEVTIKGSVITGQLKDAKKFKTYAAEYPELVRTLREKNVKITVKPEEQNPWYWNLFFSCGPIIFIVHLDILHAPDADRRQ